MPGVMDIQHLLCQSCDPYSSFSSSSLLLRKSSNDEFKETRDLIHISQRHQYYYKEEEGSNHAYLYGQDRKDQQQEILFWTRHSRSNSTQSISSCSINSDGQSNIVSHQQQQQQQEQQEYSPTSSLFSSPSHSPILKSNSQFHQQQHPYYHPRSELCRRSISTTGHYQQQQQQQQQATTQRRSRSNSTTSASGIPYIQTRTPWTPEEDELLQTGYEQGLSWAMISCTYLPHRSRGCCWGRFKTLQSKNVIEVYQQRICQRPWKVTAGGAGGGGGLKNSSKKTRGSLSTSLIHHA